MDLPLDALSVSDLPDDFVPPPCGLRSVLSQEIQELAPGTDFSDPAWGHFATPDFSIEFNMGDTEVVDGFMLHIRGGDSAVGLVADLLEHLGLRAVDCSTGDFFAPASAIESLRAWRAFRDRVMRDR